MTNQHMNPRTVTIDGETKTIAEWSKENGISTDTIYRRMKKGMAPEKAVTLPSKKSQDRSKNNTRRALAAPARQLKNKFITQLANALDGLGEQEINKIIQDQFKDDPLKFIEKVLVPLFPKDDLEKQLLGHHQNAAAFHIEFNGAPLSNPIVISEDDDTG